MTSPSTLDARGTRAYATYFVAHLVPLMVLVQLVQASELPALVPQLLSGTAWALALWRLATRFYRGQGRIPSIPEVRSIALRAAIASALATTVLRCTALQMADSGVPLESMLLIGALLFVISALLNLLTLAMFLLPVLQERLYQAWLERND